MIIEKKFNPVLQNKLPEKSVLDNEKSEEKW